MNFDKVTDMRIEAAKERFEPELRERVIEMALRTQHLSGYQEVLEAAENYFNYILKGQE